MRREAIQNLIIVTLYHIGISGGKDSTALLLWAIHESGLPRESLRITFCDTHNEDPLTENHLDLLRRSVIEPAGIVGGLEVLEPERGFFELAFWKHRFPSRKAQFCTHFLKLYPTQAWLLRHMDEKTQIVVLNGKRTKESNERNKKMAGRPERAWSEFWACEEWSPLSSWGIEQVLAIHKRYGVPLNGLYALGAKRVGCFPCINCGKAEIRLVARLRPEKITEIERWEDRFESEYGRVSTFFASKVTTPPFRTRAFKDKEGKIHFVAPIREVVKWAHTERGGKQQRLDFPGTEPCWINYGACE